MRYVIKYVEVLLVALMSVMIIIVGMMVYYRYVLSSPLGWVEEVARSCLGWVTFLGACIGIDRLGHIRITILHDIVPARWQRIFFFVTRAGMILFFIVLFFWGMRFTIRFMGMQSPYLNYPLGINYLAMPCSSVLAIAILVSQVVSGPQSLPAPEQR